MEEYNKAKSNFLWMMNNQPIAELIPPVQFDLDTSKLTDGEHTLKLISKSPTGREGIRKIKFIVKNGPAISVEGLSDNVRS